LVGHNGHPGTAALWPVVRASNADQGLVRTRRRPPSTTAVPGTATTSEPAQITRVWHKLLLHLRTYTVFCYSTTALLQICNRTFLSRDATGQLVNLQKEKFTRNSLSLRFTEIKSKSFRSKSTLKCQCFQTLDNHYRCNLCTFTRYLLHPPLIYGMSTTI